VIWEYQLRCPSQFFSAGYFLELIFALRNNGMGENRGQTGRSPVFRQDWATKVRPDFFDSRAGRVVPNKPVFGWTRVSYTWNESCLKLFAFSCRPPDSLPRKTQGPSTPRIIAFAMICSGRDDRVDLDIRTTMSFSVLFGWLFS
jgi:hypothetical protein